MIEFAPKETPNEVCILIVLYAEVFSAFIVT